VSHQKVIDTYPSRGVKTIFPNIGIKQYKKPLLGRDLKGKTDKGRKRSFLLFGSFDDIENIVPGVPV